MITTAPELIYMLKVNIGIALFYAFYKLFCCRDTFFQWRRIALLSFLALSFLYPLMDMQAWVKEQPAINELADYYTLMMLTETNTSTATVVTTPVAIPTPDLLDIIKFVYWNPFIIRTIYDPTKQYFPPCLKKQEYKCRPNIHTQSIRTCQSILFLAMDFHLSARTERR